MRNFSINPREMFKCIWHHRNLIKTSAKREIQNRYRGSVLGILWSFFIPLAMLLVYTFVFSVVFNARWGDEADSKTKFALILFIGLIIFNLFSECINRAPTLIHSNINYVKKVIFPLEILPVITLLSALFQAIISLVAWLLAYFVLFGAPPLTIIFLPVILVPLGLTILGLSWILSALGVYLKDIIPITNLATTLLMFLSPIFYPVSALPEKYQTLIFLNPLTTIIEQARSVLFFGHEPNIPIISMYWLIAFIIAWVGFIFFQTTRKGFADVL